MKNIIFKTLPAERKQKKLLHILRQKTNRLLTVKEEVALLAYGHKSDQFKICVFYDITEFINSLGFTESFNRDVIYGENAMKDIKTNNSLICTGIAVMDKSDCLCDRLLIYIPETRNCKGECVREKFICEHIEHYGNDYCCDKQLVRA